MSDGTLSQKALQGMSDLTLSQKAFNAAAAAQHFSQVLLYLEEDLKNGLDTKAATKRAREALKTGAELCQVRPIPIPTASSGQTCVYLRPCFYILLHEQLITDAT